jgi:hypothetical protein
VAGGNSIRTTPAPHSNKIKRDLVLHCYGADRIFFLEIKRGSAAGIGSRRRLESGPSVRITEDLPEFSVVQEDLAELRGRRKGVFSAACKQDFFALSLKNGSGT